MNEADVQRFFDRLGQFQSELDRAKHNGVLEHLAKEHGDEVKDDLAKLEEVVESLLDELEE